MKIMSVNSGSSSVKFQLFEMPAETVIASGQVEKIGFDDASFIVKHNGRKHSVTLPIKTHQHAVELIINGLVEQGVVNDLKEINGFGHRVVHGGERFIKSTVVTKPILDEIKALSDLAPLHNPANAISVEAFMKVLPNVVHLAVFDTAFHQTMKEDAFLYATPYEWYTKFGVRKYGFHGTSHRFVSEQVIKYLGIEDSKIVVCHIGNGASITAVRDGKCVDTSMGLTPLEGIPMGTRSGSIDPAIISFMEKKLNTDCNEIIDDLNKKSGYLGISGVTSDARDIETKIRANHQRSRLAYELQSKRIADYIGSYLVSMEGLDAIVFTAGIGENSPFLRSCVLNRLKGLGVVVDEDKNNNNEIIVTKDESKVKVFVVKTNEELMIAREVLEHI